MSMRTQSDQTWMGTSSSHPGLCSWAMLFIPTAVKVPESQEIEIYSIQQEQRHFLKRSHRSHKSHRSQWEGCYARQEVGSSRDWWVKMKQTVFCQNRLVPSFFVPQLRLSWFGSESIHWERDNFLKWNHVLGAGALYCSTPGAPLTWTIMWMVCPPVVQHTRGTCESQRDPLNALHLLDTLPTHTTHSSHK